MHRSRLGAIVIDCQSDDLDGAAAFWGAALGYPAERSADPVNARYRQLQGPPGDVQVLVQQVEHASRVHIDIETDDIEAEVGRLEGLGARRVAQVRDWWVMEAPSGQRFCVVKVQRSQFEQGANAWE